MNEHEPDDVTRLLQRAASGDPASDARLFERMHGELHALAARFLRSARPDHTLQPTALVNEAWLRLTHGEPAAATNRTHFLALAARAMRSILVDHARQKAAGKRPPRERRVPLDEIDLSNADKAALLVDLDDELAALATMDAQLARIVELRFFGGLTIDETAAALAISTPTVERGWRTAKAFLHARMSG